MKILELPDLFCTQCHEKVSIEMVELGALGVWEIECCGVSVVSPDLNSVVMIWKGQDEEKEA